MTKSRDLQTLMASEEYRILSEAKIVNEETIPSLYDDYIGTIERMQIFLEELIFLNNTEEIKALINLKAIARDYLPELYINYSSNLFYFISRDITNRFIADSKLMLTLFDIEETNTLINAKIIKPEYLVTLTVIYRNIDKVKEDINILTTIYDSNVKELIAAKAIEPKLLFETYIKSDKESKEQKKQDVLDLLNEIRKQPETIAKIEAYHDQIRKDKAFTEGATGGALDKKLPTDAGMHIGKYLSFWDGKNLAQVNKKAREAANDSYKQEEKNVINSRRKKY